MESRSLCQVACIVVRLFLVWYRDCLCLSQKKSSCTVAERSFSVGTISEILQALVTVSGGRQVAGRLSNRLLPVLVAGVRDSDPEVRNNSVFGLGCLAEASGPLVKSYPSHYFYACL